MTVEVGESKRFFPRFAVGWVRRHRDEKWRHHRVVVVLGRRPVRSGQADAVSGRDFANQPARCPGDGQDADDEQCDWNKALGCPVQPRQTGPVPEVEHQGEWRGRKDGRNRPESVVVRDDP